MAADQQDRVLDSFGRNERFGVLFGHFGALHICRAKSADACGRSSLTLSDRLILPSLSKITICDLKRISLVLEIANCDLQAKRAV
jgi:hypothetical protein